MALWIIGAYEVIRLYSIVRPLWLLHAVSTRVTHATDGGRSLRHAREMA